MPFYTAAIRREAWDAVGGYDPGVPDIDESVLIWLRLAEQFEVRLIPDQLGVYRVREQSLSRDPAKVEQFESSLIRTFEMFAEEARRPELRLALRAPGAPSQVSPVAASGEVVLHRRGHGRGSKVRP